MRELSWRSAMGSLGTGLEVPRKKMRQQLHQQLQLQQWSLFRLQDQCQKEGSGENRPMSTRTRQRVMGNQWTKMSHHNNKTTTERGNQVAATAGRYHRYHKHHNHHRHQKHLRHQCRWKHQQ
jgi:hypothetical protein